MQQCLTKKDILQSVHAHAVLCATGNLAFHVDRRSAHGNFERVPNASAKKRFQRSIDARVDAVVGNLAVALGKCVDKLLNLSQLTKNDLSAKGLLILNFESEVAKKDGRVCECLHASIDRGNDVLGDARNSLVPRQDLRDRECNSGREMWVRRAGAAKESCKAFDCSLVG